MLLTGNVYSQTVRNPQSRIAALSATAPFCGREPGTAPLSQKGGGRVKRGRRVLPFQIRKRFMETIDVQQRNETTSPRASKRDDPRRAPFVVRLSSNRSGALHSTASVGSYILDFYCPSLKLAIELDGSQHYEETGREYDLRRTAVLAGRGISVIRFPNNAIWDNFRGVCEQIDLEIRKRETLSQPR